MVSAVKRPRWVTALLRTLRRCLRKDLQAVNEPIGLVKCGGCVRTHVRIAISQPWTFLLKIATRPLPAEC